MQVANFTLAEIGLLGSLYFAVNFIADVPTGIFADRVGKVASLNIGAAMNIVSTLLYVFYPTQVGIVCGVVIEALGYAFLVGPGEALVHDSLVVQKREGDYTKVVSRTQSISLVVNAGLLVLVTMTYKIDPKLPFFIGSLAYTVLLLASSFMNDVANTSKVKARHVIWPILKSPGMSLLAVFYGIFGALYTAPSDMVNITFKQLGLQPALLGWVFAAASLCGALGGVYFHKLRSLSISKYVLVDMLCLVSPFIAIYLGSLELLVVTFIIQMSMWRYRRSLYQQNLLSHFPNQPKTTLFSMMNNFEGINLIWLPATVAYAVTHFGINNGFGLITVFSLLIGLCFMLSARKFFNAPPKTTFAD